ncbi:unnamed protein product [Citrullus colocynthis]|uniref:Uncharacterized protein n=1 Tax=Citrullus colocynthis TaxID=252529 RepID=A0ABP0YJC2_9ROSI
MYGPLLPVELFTCSWIILHLNTYLERYPARLTHVYKLTGRKANWRIELHSLTAQTTNGRKIQRLQLQRTPKARKYLIISGEGRNFTGRVNNRQEN